MMCKAVGSDLLWSSAALSHAAGLGWRSPHNGSLRLIKAKVLRGRGLWKRLKKTVASSVHQGVEVERIGQTGRATGTCANKVAH